jgi:hypothetical protein
MGREENQTKLGLKLHACSCTTACSNQTVGIYLFGTEIPVGEKKRGKRRPWPVLRAEAGQRHHVRQHHQCEVSCAASQRCQRHHHGKDAIDTKVEKEHHGKKRVLATVVMITRWSRYCVCCLQGGCVPLFLHLLEWTLLLFPLNLSWTTSCLYA